MMVDQTGRIEDLPLSYGMDFSPIFDEELLRWITEAEYLGVSRETAVLIATKRRALKLSGSCEPKPLSNGDNTSSCHCNNLPKPDNPSSDHVDGEITEYCDFLANTDDTAYKSRLQNDASSESNEENGNEHEEEGEEEYGDDENDDDYDDYTDDNQQEFSLKTGNRTDKISVSPLRTMVCDTNQVNIVALEEPEISGERVVQVPFSQIPMLNSNLGFKCKESCSENNTDDNAGMNTNLATSEIFIKGSSNNDVLSDNAISNPNQNFNLEERWQRSRKKKNTNNNNNHSRRRRKRLNNHKQPPVPLSSLVLSTPSHQTVNSSLQTVSQPTSRNYKNKEEGKHTRSDRFSSNLTENTEFVASTYRFNSSKQNSKTLSNAALLRKIVEGSKTKGRGYKHLARLSDDNSSVDTTMGVVNSGFDQVDNIHSFSSALDAVVAAHTCNPLNNNKIHSQTNNRVQGTNHRARRKGKQHIQRTSNSNAQSVANGCTNLLTTSSSGKDNHNKSETALCVTDTQNCVSTKKCLNGTVYFSGTGTVNAFISENPAGQSNTGFENATPIGDNDESGVFPEPPRMNFHKGFRHQLRKHKKRPSQSLSNNSPVPPSSLHSLGRNFKVETKSAEQGHTHGGNSNSGTNNVNANGLNNRRSSANTHSVRPRSRSKSRRSEAVEHVREQLRIAFRSRGVLGV